MQKVKGFKRMGLAVLVLALALNFTLLVTPMFSETREEFCAAPEQNCTNQGGPLCATKKVGDTTWYCYYGNYPI